MDIDGEGTSSKGSSSKKPKRFQITKSVAFGAIWDGTNCAICLSDLTEPCSKCADKTQTRDCILVVGECKHVFHFDCMEDWSKRSNNCPADRGVFKQVATRKRN